MSNSWRNRDYLKRLNFPRQSYALSGADFGDAAADAITVRGKYPVNASPMIISNLPPGAHAKNDEIWSQIYGASQDAFLSLLNGNTLNDNILSSNADFTANYRKALPLAVNLNIYDPVEGIQQVQFVAGRDTVAEMRIDEPMEAFEARSIGLRMPAHICGWGKTITMRPTDPDPLDKRVNDDEHKLDRSSWPVGPLDVRWDSVRKVWRAWNDLVADDEEQNLGTFVFSTNPDNTDGFPFLRGRLEDVWSVRKTFRESSSAITAGARNNDVTKSARVCTKLDGLAIQDDLVAEWSSALKITDACISGPSVTVGAETTTEAELVILTSAKFYQNSARVGSIAFNGDLTDDLLVGSMYYSGTGACGQWVPAVPKPDICELGGDVFDIVWDNDKILQTAIKSLGDAGVNKNRTDLKTATQKLAITNFQSFITTNAGRTGFGDIDAWADAIQTEINKQIKDTAYDVINGVRNRVDFLINALATQLVACINAGFLSIATDLAENCSCDVGVYTCEIPSIVSGPILIGDPDINVDLNLDNEIALLNSVEGALSTNSDQINNLISLFDIPIIINLGTITDPCPPNTTVTKTFTLGG